MAEIDRINNIPNVGGAQGVSKVGKVTPAGTSPAAEAVRRGGTPGVSFETLLQEQLDKNSRIGLQFSKHARERVEERGINLTDDLMNNLTNAVSKARAKGARDVVIFDTARAFIVNIPNNMVITTMTDREMKENVFTNIDSAVIL